MIMMLAMVSVCTFAGEWQWSVSIKGMVSSETNRNPDAFLWIPPKCEMVRAVIVGQHNMSEETLFEMDSFRQKLADMGVGMIWITPGLDQQWKVEKGVQKAFETMMNDDEKGKRLTSKGNYVDRSLNDVKMNSQELFYAMAYSNSEKK